MHRFFRTGLFLLFLLLLSKVTLAQNRTITGKVTLAENNSSLPGATILLKGTTNGSLTDTEGNYRLTVPAGGTITLVISFIGMETQEIMVPQGRSVVNAALTESLTELTQLVVTGYNEMQRRDVISSIASVKGEKLKELAVGSFDQAMQGQMAGVQISASSGTPGGGFAVRIRGNTSIYASNRPLFIIDGIPVYDSPVSQRDFGGQEDNALSFLNNNDIETIQVLKDAAAKAIYGSRGANGVVVVTTKKGRNNKTVITADVLRGVTEIIRKTPVMNASQLLELQREALINAGENPDEAGLIPGVTDKVDTDWQDAVLRRGILQQYQVSASGGNDRTKFYLSTNLRDEEGVILNNRFIRYSGSLNVDHKASQKLSFGANILLTFSRNDRVKGDNFLDGVYSAAVNSLPFYSPYDQWGRLEVPGSLNYAEFPNFNPVGQAVLPRFQTFGNKILAGANVDFESAANLRFRSKVSIDYNSSIEDQFEPSTTAIGGYLESVGHKGYGVFSSDNDYSLLTSNTLSYFKALSERENFNLLLGAEVMHRRIRSSNVQGRLFPRDDFTYITSAGIVDQGSSVFSQNGLVSFFAEAKYDFADKYLLGITGRYDGSSRFGAKRRFGFFPSLSLGWRISEEDFFKDIPLFSDLKLRGSYGFVGNEGIPNYRFLGTWSTAVYNGVAGVGPEALPNSDLRWERTNEINLGLDASFAKNRLHLILDLYKNTTNDLLFPKPLPATVGFGSVWGNIGRVSNKGIELTVSTVNTTGDVRWTTDLNITRNINRVEFLPDHDTLFFGYQASGVSNTNVVMENQPLGTFWGLKFLGVDPATGDAIYDDINGDGHITAADGQVIGNAQPLFYGGITNRVSWKGFDFSFMFQYSYGNKVLNFSNTSLVNAGADILTNQSTIALRRWKKEGDITDVPRYVHGSTYNNWHSDRFLEDGSYIRLKNITLGYNLPENLVNKIRLTKARIFVTGSNLWTRTAYSGPDPEVSTLDRSTVSQSIDLYTLPLVKTVQAGLSVSF